MSSDEPAEEQSEESADSDDSDEEEDSDDADNLSAFKKVHEVIVSRWVTVNKSVRKAKTKLQFYKRIQRRHGRAESETVSQFCDLPCDDEQHEEEESGNKSRLRQIYFDNLPKKLSCILETEETASDEERRLRKLRIKKKVKDFVLSVKKRTTFKRRVHPKGGLKEDLPPDLQYDEEENEINFEFYVRQEIARRKKKYLQTQGNVANKKKLRKASVSSANEKLALEVDLQPSKSKQSSGRKDFDAKDQIPKEKLFKDVKSDVPQAKEPKETPNFPSKSPKSSDQQKTVGKTAPSPKDGVANVASSAQKLKSTKNQKKLSKQSVAHNVARVQPKLANEHTDWLLLDLDPGVDNKMAGKKVLTSEIKIKKPKEIKFKLPEDSLQQSARIKGYDASKDAVRRQLNKRPSTELRPRIPKAVQKQMKITTKSSVQANQQDVPTKKVVLKENDPSLGNNVKSAHPQMFASTSGKAKGEVVSVHKMEEEPSGSKVKNLRKTEESLQKTNRKKQTTRGSDDDAVPRSKRPQNINLDQSSKKEKIHLDPSNTATHKLPYSTGHDSEDEMDSSGSSQESIQTIGFAKFLPSFDFLRIFKFWDNGFSASAFEDTSVTPPMSLFRGNKSFSDAIFKIKLRAAKQMRTNNLKGLPLQEPVLTVCEPNESEQSEQWNLPTEQMFLPPVQSANNKQSLAEEVQQQDLLPGCNVNGLNTEKVGKNLSDCRHDYWQRFASFDYMPDEDYYEDLESCSTRFAHPKFNHGTSFFDLLYKIKWLPGSHAKKKTNCEDEAIYEHNFYSPRDYLDKYGVPIPARGRNSNIEEDFIFETAWQKTISVAKTDESTEMDAVKQPTKILSNSQPEKRSHACVETVQFVTNSSPISAQSATSELRRSSKATRGYAVQLEESSSRKSLESDPPSFNLKRPKTFLLNSADRADDDDDDDDESDESDSDESSSSDDEDDDIEEEDVRPRDRSQGKDVSSDIDASDTSTSNTGITTKASKVIDRIVSMFSLTNVDGVPETVRVLDVDAMDEIPDQHVDPHSIIITDLIKEDLKLDPASNICVDLKARRKEALTKLLVRATGNKYMTEYFRLEIERRAESNHELANTSKVSFISTKEDPATSKSSKADTFSEEFVPIKSTSNSKPELSSSAHSTAGMDPIHRKGSLAKSSVQQNRNLIKRPSSKGKVSKDFTPTNA